MALRGDSSSSDGSSKPCTSNFSLPMKLNVPEEGTPWIGYALQQALIYQKTVLGTLDDTMKLARAQRSEILSSLSVQLRKTMDLLAYAKSQYLVQENKLFASVKEGVKVSASHPFVSGPRRFLYYNTLRFFVGEELLLSRADAKVKEMRKLFSFLKAENEKLEMRTSCAEADFMRGRMKLSQAGKQIRGVVQAAYKIEKQARGIVLDPLPCVWPITFMAIGFTLFSSLAAGLRDITWGLHLPARETSNLRSQISSLERETKKERMGLLKEVAKISDHGIPV